MNSAPLLSIRATKNCVHVVFSLYVAALFSQVAVLAAVLALVVIIILSIIILIAVWRKVRQTQPQTTSCAGVTCHSKVTRPFVRICAWSETSLRDPLEGDRVCESGRSRVHLRGPHPLALWPHLGDAQRQPGAGWVLHTQRLLLSHLLLLLK